MENLRNKTINFGNNIKKIREKNGFSVRQASIRAHMSNSYWSQVENAKRDIPTPKTLRKMAKGLRISEKEIFELAGITAKMPKNIIPYDENNVVQIPLIGEIACGDPILAQENIDGYVPTSKSDLFYPQKEYFYLKCRGDSMYPTIPNGANVLIHSQPTVENGEIAAVLILENNEATLKRIEQQEGQTILLPDNKNYKPIVLNKNNPGKIMGKAVMVKAEL